MANQIAGRVYRIDPIVNIPLSDGTEISKTQLLLNTCTFDQITGEKIYKDLFVKFDVMGNATNDMIELQTGDEIIVSYDMIGSKLFTNKDGIEDCANHPKYKSCKVVSKSKANVQQAQAAPQFTAAPQAPAPQHQLYIDQQTGRKFYYDESGNPQWAE